MSFIVMIFMFAIGLMFASMIPTIIGLLIAVIALPFSMLSGIEINNEEAIKFDFKPPIASAFEHMSTFKSQGPFLATFMMLVFQLPELIGAGIFAANSIQNNDLKEAALLGALGVAVVSAFRFGYQLRSFKRNGLYCVPSKKLENKYVVIDNRKSIGEPITLVFNDTTLREFEAGKCYWVYSTPPSLKINIKDDPSSLSVGANKKWAWGLPIEIRSRHGKFSIHLPEGSHVYPNNNKMWV